MRLPLRDASGMDLRRFVILGPVLAGCGGVDVNAGDVDAAPAAEADGAPGAADAGRPDGSPGSVVLRYDFDAGLIDDGGARYVPDVGGGDRRGLVLGAVGGEALLEVLPREEGTGNAVRFPGECMETDPMLCPHVIVEAEDSTDQDPGERDFAISVDFLMPSLPAGSSIIDQNVMQKGNFDDPGQWKVEIDRERRPTCVFHYPDDAGTPITARIQREIDDGIWHTLRCERRGNFLMISLDSGEGEDSRSIEIPAGHTVTITNPQPIRIGGQNVMASADQFHGSLDNISIEIF
jgi:hypothetical protein